MSSNRSPDECNDGGCEPLHIVSHELSMLRQKHTQSEDRARRAQEEADGREGRFIAAVGDAMTASDRAEKASNRAAAVCLNIERRLFEPADRALVQHHTASISGRHLAPAYDEGEDGMGEFSGMQDLPTMHRRAKKAEKQRLIGAITSLVLLVAGILTAVGKAKGWVP